MRRVAIGVGVFGLLALVPPGAWAEPLSLDEAVEIALANNPSVLAAAQQIEAAAGQVDAVRADLTPTIGFELAASQYDGKVFYDRFIGPGPPGESEGTDVGDFGTNLAWALTLRQNLYTGGAVGAQRRAREVEQSIAGLQLERARRDIVFAVTKAYYDALLAQQASTVADAAVERSASDLEVVENRRAEQEALRVELLGAEARLEADRLAQRQARNDQSFARFELNRLLGRPADEPIELVGDLDRASEPLDAAAVEQTVLGNHPALRSAGLKSELGTAQLDGARSHYRPKVRLEAFFSDIENQVFFEGAIYGASLEVGIPLFADRIAGHAAVRSAEALLGAAESELADATAALTLAARQAVRQVEESRDAVNVARRALEYRQEEYRVTQSAFEETLATSADLQAASSELSEAELELQGALHAARLAEADLARLTGSEVGHSPR